ncbi:MULTISPECIES: SDR family NAD(P)-dependent oxidoreductase [Rhodomicrobium]|uniref:SDR family NAD(P)-dependent oxidoreductase n=1 Tax=Rhodomicrobium TaxID=1068 RepID=UPI000B4A6E82|nr:MULTISPECIES: SDR family NAD(P)-dependent oxidoreductase [Rhodomicrobium]
MKDLPFNRALIIGAGPGISAALARCLTSLGVLVSLGARNIEKLQPLVEETGARAYQVDAAEPDAMASLFETLEAETGDPDVVVFNAAAPLRGSLDQLDPRAAQKSIAATAFGGLLTVHHAARRMVPLGRGAILLTGNTASIKGFANSAAFAMGKFALRGLAQSAARELGPKGIHVAHVVVDGFVRSGLHLDPEDKPDSTLDPHHIAQSYVDLLCQPRSAWTDELVLRPWVERF